MIERAESDASSLRRLPAEDTKQNLQLEVDIIEEAIESGMPEYYGVQRLGWMASRFLDEKNSDVPLALEMDNCVRRILLAIRLTREKALDLAVNHSNDLSEDDPDFDTLREICWLLPDLKRHVRHVRDEQLVGEICIRFSNDRLA